LTTTKGWQCAMKELDLEFMNEYEKSAFEGPFASLLHVNNVNNFF